MDRLKEIEGERSTLLRRLDVLEAEKHELLMKKHGIVIGMLVKDKQGKYYKVTGARNLDWDQPWLTGNLQRKDGTFGVERTVYDPWEKL